MSRRILLVEDNQAALAAYRDALNRTDWEIFVASTLGEAKAALGHLGIFDVVLLDIGLPDGNGLDLLEVVRQSGAEPIIVTGSIGAEIITKGGGPHIVTDSPVLTKPIELGTLHNALEHAYERQRARVR